MKTWSAVTCLIAGALLAPAAAYAATKEVAGEPQMAREITGDTSISARVKAEFAKDKQVSAMSINVDSNKGVVTLRGNAKSREEAARAAMLARRVQGVTSVKNDIQVGAGKK